VTCTVFSATPNFVKTTSYWTDHAGAAQELVTQEFADGLNRGIQSQALLPGNMAIVGGAYFDDAGRAWRTPRNFVFQSDHAFIPDTIVSGQPDKNLITKANDY
jgi:hypothetical protein